MVVTRSRPFSVTVVAGDTLWSLAAQYYGNGMDWRKIYAANPQLQPDPNRLVPPQRLIIPPLATPLTQPSNAVKKIASVQVVAQLATILASSLAPALAVSAVYAAMKSDTDIDIGADRLGELVVDAVLKIIEHFQTPTLEGIGAAQREVVRMNTMRKASFLLVSTQRMLTSINAALAQGVPQSTAITNAVNAENRYYAQHYTASSQRMDAATRIDSLQMQHGDVLGWHAVMDKKATAECRSANGKNFSALIPPAIGWPGIVHVNCRCYPGKPFADAAMLP